MTNKVGEINRKVKHGYKIGEIKKKKQRRQNRRDEPGAKNETFVETENENERKQPNIRYIKLFEVERVLKVAAPRGPTSENKMVVEF